MMQINLIEFATPEYDEAVRLRYEVLRKPLGLEYTAEQLSAEYDHLHLAAFDHRYHLIGYLNLTPLSETLVKMRQVAVADHWQGKGVGTALVRASEQVARQHGYLQMVLSARESAVPFYLTLGYVTVGERFEEVTIPHLKMEKMLDG